MVYNDTEACQQSRSQHPSILSPRIATDVDELSINKWMTGYVRGQLGVVSAPRDNMLYTCKYTGDGTPGWEVWGTAFGEELVPGVLSLDVPLYNLSLKQSVTTKGLNNNNMTKTPNEVHVRTPPNNGQNLLHQLVL